MLLKMVFVRSTAYSFMQFAHFFRIIVDDSILGVSSPRKSCLLLAHLQLVSLSRVIIMATSNATFTPLCASCSDPGNSPCSGCYLVTVSRASDQNKARSLTNPIKYCGKTCQKAHWATHKPHCTSPLGKKSWQPEWARQQREPAFSSEAAVNSLFGTEKWLWGNTPSVDIIKLGRNEGETYQQDLNVLFAGMPILFQPYAFHSLIYTQLLATFVTSSQQLLPYPCPITASH